MVIDSIAQLQEALGDRYRIERELGRGGMATVYLATDRSLDRQVALKVLHRELAATLGPERFQQEIRTAARLQHPHILPLFESGVAGDRLWYTMPYVEGETLRHRLMQERQLPIDEALRISMQVLGALEYAHRHGVLHRDIKPENILLEGDQAVVADLGIARAIGAAGDDRLTETGLTVGTPAYMSPEQAAGDRELDARSDIYSMGTVLYEMLVGEPPFGGPTAQAVLARKLSEVPRPLRSTRDSVPAEVEAAVLKALSRAPADRPRSAGEFASQLEIGAPTVIRSSTRTRPALTRRLVVALATVVAAAAVATALYRRSQTASTLDSSLVAVAPFDVLDPKLQLWREGLVDLLSRNLDGAGPLRTVAPTVVVRRWRGRGDQQSAVELGRRTGAGLALYGSLLSAGADSVRMSAALLDVQRVRVVDEWELRDLADRMDRVSDSLTMQLLRALGRERPIGSVRLVGYGSSSLPAVKAFLQGEQLLRRSEWDSALVYYERAIALDSTFAPALRRASTALGWIRTGSDSLSNSYALRAGIHNHGLPLRDSLLIAADSVFASLLNAGAIPLRADSLWGPRLHRFSTMLERLTARYPEDPEVWQIQGEADNHLGPYADRTVEQQLESFDHAIALDSAFAPLYIHPIEASARFGADAMRKYLNHFVRLAQGDKNADGAHLLKVLLDSLPGPAERLQLYQKISGDGLFATYLAVSSLPDSAELVVSIARYLSTHLMSSPPLNNPSSAKRSYARALMSRGHLAAALQQLPDREPGPAPGALFSEAALLGAVPVTEASRRFQARLTDGPIFPLIMAFPWWGTTRDSISLRIAAKRADSLARSSPDSVVRSQARYASLSAAAYVALAAKDTARAVERLLGLSRDLCPGCFLDRVTLAQLLLERHRDQEAMKILRVDHPSLSVTPTATAVLWTLLRGRVAERMKEPELALQSYAWVAGMWRNADPELQPYVTEARDGLARLTAERK